MPVGERHGRVQNLIVETLEAAGWKAYPEHRVGKRILDVAGFNGRGWLGFEVQCSPIKRDRAISRDQNSGMDIVWFLDIKPYWITELRDYVTLPSKGALKKFVSQKVETAIASYGAPRFRKTPKQKRTRPLQRPPFARIHRPSMTIHRLRKKCGRSDKDPVHKSWVMAMLKGGFVTLCETCCDKRFGQLLSPPTQQFLPKI